MTKRAQLLAIIAAVLLAFFPVIFAEVSMVDDYDMLSVCQKSGWTLQKLFFPGNGNGLYYRPLTFGTYLLDINLIGPDPVWMHLVNVLLHLANTLLVFRLVAQLMPQLAIGQKTTTTNWLPMGLALLWGFHPLTTESVAWISGRTDIFSAFFILLSTSCLLRFRQHHSALALSGAFLSFFAGILSKEVAIAFLPGALLLLLAPDASAQKKFLVQHRKKFFLFLGIGGLAIGLFFLMRHFAYSSNQGKIGLTLKIISSNPHYAFFTTLKAVGFYMKKLFSPWPLNFAIDGVDPLYELLAFPLLGFFLFLLWEHSLLAALFLSGVFLIAPAIPLAMNQIAWMPYAERYLYLPSVFVTLAAGLFLAKRPLPKLSNTGRKLLFLSAITIFAVSTVQRNMTWQTNLALFEDTAKKSEGNRTILELHSSALLNSGQPKKALAVAQQAAATPMLGYKPNADNLIGESLFRLGRTEEALAAYTRSNTRCPKGSTEALRGMVEIYTTRMYRSPTKNASADDLQRLEAVSLKLFEKQKDPMVLYNLAKAFHASGQTETARKYWRLTLEHMAPDHSYRQFAIKLASQRG